MEDDEIQSRIDNAVAGETATATADKPTESPDETPPEDVQPSGDEPKPGEETDTPPADDKTPPAGDQPAEDEPGDDDVDELDFAPPVITGAPQGGEIFDIRTLPRDENGAIKPDEANKAIQDWHNDQLAKASQSNNATAQTREVLSNQWQRGFTKYPHIAKNKDLANLAREMHLSSITAAREGTGPYHSPLSAMRRIDSMYRKAVKTGVESNKTRRTIVKNTATETPSGKGDAAAPTDEYTKAKKASQSSDPKTAKAGRLKIMELRRKAREG